VRGAFAEAHEENLPLRVGDVGTAVADLQVRLAELGFVSDDPAGTFGEATGRAVASFQIERGLTGDGTCDEHTWSAVVEAGFRLGSRLLYRRTPMLRGEDVAELQRRLSRLGFDTGRVDGIFGNQTVDALTEFQRNVGLHADGVLGHRTLSELDRLSMRTGTSSLVSPVRERLAVVESGRASGLIGRRVAVIEPGGFSTGSAAVCRALRDAGVSAALAFSHRDPSRCAGAANEAKVDCLVALRLTTDGATCRTAYYRGFRYESAASRHLAELIQTDLPRALNLADGGIRGMALPILRETRMPAVEIELGLPEQVVPRTALLAKVIVSALERWTGADWA